MTNQQADETEDEFDGMSSRIKHLLEIYPGISPTMLQAILGPQTRAAAWRPVLEEMIAQGAVVQTVQTATTPKGRRNDYTKLTLA